MPSPNPMTKDDAARIQAGQAKAGHDMGPGGFAARAQAAGDRHENAAAAEKGQGQSASGGGNQGDANKGNDKAGK